MDRAVAVVAFGGGHGLYASLSALRGQPADSADVGLDAVLIALSGRVRLREGCSRTTEEIITELWFEILGSDRSEFDGDRDATGKASAPTGASRS